MAIRKLSDTFQQNLLQGFLGKILTSVKADPDLDLQIRLNYLNIYYKGNSLLKLSESSPSHYKVDIHPKFTGDKLIPDLTGEDSSANFVTQIPYLKSNIIQHGKSSLEIEYEQLIIRANNNEPRNNTEYFILDRQYTDPKGRFDLVGIFWRIPGRKKGDMVPLCLVEVKFALNPDIGRLHEQLGRYYKAMQPVFPEMAEEFEGILQQKLDLGLFDQPPGRLAAMRTLHIDPDIKSAQFIIVLVDYNPYSSFYHRARLGELPFKKQVKVFHAGFGMWGQNLEALASPHP